MSKYEIGKPFPDRRCLSIDGAAIRFSETSFDIVAVMDKLHVDELLIFSNRMFTYGLFVENHIPFMVFDFDNQIKMNCVFNLLSLTTERAVHWLLLNSIGLLTVYFIEKEFGILQGTRSFRLSTEFIDQLKIELGQLWRTYKSKDQIRDEIARILNENNPGMMCENCNTRFSVM